MKTTVREILSREDVRESETLYGLNESEINEFQITAGDFFRFDKTVRWLDNSWIWKEYETRLEKLKCSETYRKLRQQEISLRAQIREIKEEDPKGYSHMEELRALRTVIHGIEDALQGLGSAWRSQAAYELGEKFGVTREGFLSYKNTVSVGSFADLERQAKAFGQVRLSWIRKIPLLLGNLGAAVQAVKTGEPVGIVGGPCLFGTHEVEVLVRRKDGGEASFDFSSGHRYDRTGAELELADYLERCRADVTEIAFRDKKKGVTVQEQESLEVLFALAEPLGARVAVPIPDISYLKYLYTITLPLAEEIRRRSLEEFRKITQRIADLYLVQIEGLKKKYPAVEVQVLHERNEKLCALFYEKREEFFRRSGLIRRLTAKREKTDAIFDYISMLALPYYIWEVPHVIQVDNLDETDSYRKCRKVHKRAFTLSAVLYPERLSADGEHTIFNAPIEYKEYI